MTTSTEQQLKPVPSSQGPAASSAEVFQQAEVATKLDLLLKEIQSVKEKVDSSMIADHRGVIKVIDALLRDKDIPQEAREELAEKIRKLERADANWLERAVYAVEDWSRGWLPAIAKTAGYGGGIYVAGKAAYRGVLFAWRSLRGDVGGAVNAVVE